MTDPCGLPAPHISLWAAFYYHLHRYPCTGVTVGLWLGRTLRLRFHRVRDVVVGLDALLSALLHLSLVASVVTVPLALLGGALLPALAALTGAAACRVLLRLERRLARRYWPMRLDVHNIATGSARTLRGHIVVGHLFVNEGERYWTHGRVACSMERAQHATAWLEKQAARHGVPLTMTHLDLGHTPVGPTRSSPARLASELLRARVSPDRPAGICLALHLAHLPFSCAFPSRLGVRLSGPVELCLISSDAAPAVHAHELLHLFGADDHYHCLNESEREAKGALIGRSVMFDTSRPLGELAVDGVTAQSIGWL